MPALKNTRQELFCQYLIRGKPPGGAEGAYVLAGYKRDDKNAARLTKNDGVRARRLELIGELTGSVLVTAESMTLELQEIHEQAMLNGNLSAAVSAATLKARIHGIGADLRVKHDHTHNFEKMTPDELAFEWASMLAAIREANGLDDNGKPIVGQKPHRNVGRW